jgi:6-phosphogluconolactonase
MAGNVSVEIVDQKSFAGVVADEIVASITDSIHDHGRCLIALCGGGTPSNIYRLLARPPRVSDIEWDKVHIFWGDERWVPADHNRSNFRMTQETLLSHINIPAKNIHPVDTSLASAKKSAQVYEEEIRKTAGIKDKEIPVFDLVLLGLGEDGHTASLFPGSKAIAGEKKGVIACAVKHPDGDESRVTLAPGVLFSARQILFLVKGEGKSEILKKTLEGEEKVAEIPAQLYRKVSDNVTWFVDSAAATQLEAV